MNHRTNAIRTIGAAVLVTVTSGAIWVQANASPSLTSDANRQSQTAPEVSAPAADPGENQLRLAQEEVPRIGHREALQIQAKHYAEKFNVSEEEALRRLDLQLATGPSAGEFESIQPDRIAGVWIEHTDPYRLVVWVTGSADGLDAINALALASPMPVEVRTGAKNSYLSLTILRAELEAKLPNDGSLGGSYIDVRTGTIQISIQPQATFMAADLRPLVPEGTPATLTMLNSPAGDDSTYGGGNLNITGQQDGCTAGLTVSNYSGATGVITARHCANALTFLDFGTPADTTFVAEVWTAYRDVQWSSVVGTEIPYYFNGSTLLEVNATYSAIQQTIGGQACRYGRTTGYACLYLAAKDFRPTYDDACPSTCAAAWMLANDGFETGDGDSGGPWFNGGVGLGITKGKQGGGSIYMQIDNIDLLSLYVLTQ